MEFYGSAVSVVETRYVHRSPIVSTQVAGTKTTFKECSRVVRGRIDTVGESHGVFAASASEISSWDSHEAADVTGYDVLDVVTEASSAWKQFGHPKDRHRVDNQNQLTSKAWRSYFTSRQIRQMIPPPSRKHSCIAPWLPLALSGRCTSLFHPKSLC